MEGEGTDRYILVYMNLKMYLGRGDIETGQ